MGEEGVAQRQPSAMQHIVLRRSIQAQKLIICLTEPRVPHTIRAFR